MVISPPLLLVIFIPISLAGEFVMAPRVTAPQIGSVGPTGVLVGVGV